MPPARALGRVFGGRYTVCSTTMGMSGIARAAVTCKLRCRARLVSGVCCVRRRAARRSPNAGHLPDAKRVPRTNIPCHIPPQLRPGFRPMAELQLPMSFAPTALSHDTTHFREAGRARSGAGRSLGTKWSSGGWGSYETCSSSPFPD